MTAVVSAGVLVHRVASGVREFLLVHPGGPFWKNKDEAAWSIPKGLVEPGEDLWAAARREFAEELGRALAACRMPGGKTVHAWLVEADVDVTTIVSNAFEIEWPPRSGRRASFPEVDRAAWFDATTAATKIHRGLRPLLDEAVGRLAGRR